jgi:alpha-L-rhamnosidase
MRDFFVVATRFVLLLSISVLPAAEQIQTPGASSPLDLTADIDHPVLESAAHKPLPEQYIWLPAPGVTDAKADDAMPRYFRLKFTLESLPAAATLYVAGPYNIRAYLNGQLVVTADRDPKAKTWPLVAVADVAGDLRKGSNVLAIEANGESPLVAKILPASTGVLAPALVITSAAAKASLRNDPRWQETEFTDAAWPAAIVFGNIETRTGNFRRDFLVASNMEWNDDSEMYRWPGYDGISPYLAHLPFLPEGIRNVASGAGHFEYLAALRQKDAPNEFTVHVAPESTSVAGIPSLVLDFGRESDGRLEIVSDSAAPAHISIQYGESLEEALNAPYLGVNEMIVPARATVYGPKSAFRYVQIKFLGGASPIRFKAIRLDAIYYPVHTRGSFESSDALLNRIYAVGAYTSHLCMQDAIWDAPKRDRLPWMGDLDVSGQVIDIVFADHFLMQNTMDRLLEEAGKPINQDVNSISGYSAFWVMGEADYFRHIGDAAYLHSIHNGLIQLLDFMAGELDGNSMFVNPRKSWPFVDWSPGLFKDNPETRRATQLEFYKAFSDGAWLLRQTGDTTSADKYESRAASMLKSAQEKLLDPATGTFGSRWQTNAMAIYSGVANAQQIAAIYQQVLSRPSQFMITPYYNFYVISAMAQAGHRREALDWIRKYWGGMIAEGATSFWEGYDTSWPKENFHANLQADDSKGYFVSLSHGWSSGPTAWLSEQVLGVRPASPGFAHSTIRPDLMGLEWAKGSVPTPQGEIRVDYRATKTLNALVELPPGVEATVSMPICGGKNSVTLDGVQAHGKIAEGGTRIEIQVAHPGNFALQSDCVADSSATH